VEGIDRLLAELTAWSADQRADEAARSRTVERSLRQQAIEEATFAGTLLDLAEAGAPLAVQVRGGRQYRGVAAGVGRDFVAVRTDGGHLTLIAFAHIAAVRPTDVSAPASGARPPGPRSLVQLLDLCVGDRPRVQVVAAGETVVGELVAVGTDVLSVRADAAGHGERHVTYVPAGSVSEVSLG
jgi:hypothetical protein